MTREWMRVGALGMAVVFAGCASAWSRRTGPVGLGQLVRQRVDRGRKPARAWAS